MTSVIVRVADSVTESSSGKFIMETPQTNGTGPPLPAGQWQTDLGQAALCPGPCSPLLSSPLLTTPCSLVLLGGFVSGRLSLYAHCIFRSDEVLSGRFCRVSLISLSFNTVSRCKTVTLLPFDPLDFFYWAPFIKLVASERLESQYFLVSYSCTNFVWFQIRDGSV